MNRWKYQLTKPVVDRKELDAVAHVLESGWLAEGKETETFERRVAEYVGIKHVVAVSNCTVALELCLRVQNMPKQVEISDFAHPATIQSVINAYGMPMLSDVNLETYNTQGMYSGVCVPVSWGGNPLTCETKGIVIEDAACSLGSATVEERTGSFSFTCFSLHPRKVITTGEGGLITVNNDEMMEKIRGLKNFGKGGGNYKFDDIRAAIGLAQMDKLERIIERRIHMAHVYDDLLKDTEYIKAPEVAPGIRHTYQTYAVYLKRGNRDQIIEKLKEQSIETNRGAYALHLLPQYANVQRIGDLHNSELLDAHLLALPMAYDIDEEGQKFVVSCLKQALS